MGGVAANTGGLRQRERIKGMGEVLGDVVVANGGQEAAQWYIQIYFGGDKGKVLEIRQAWQGQGEAGK